MMKKTPTLPEERRMLLGVAYILPESLKVGQRRLNGSDPEPMMRLKIRNAALMRPGRLVRLVK
jgi:hypothetical protein